MFFISDENLSGRNTILFSPLVVLFGNKQFSEIAKFHEKVLTMISKRLFNTP